MWAYRRRRGEEDFVRQFHIPCGSSADWLRNSSRIRRLMGRPACVELLPLADGGSLAHCGGTLWRRDSNSSHFRPVHRLRHFGLRTGCGILHAGLTGLPDGRVFYGEYWRNPEHTEVCIWESDPTCEHWRVAHEFGTGEVRHVHAVQYDPYEKVVWICTGDLDREAMIATFGPDQQLRIVGQGSQQWRTCQLVFTTSAVYWGADCWGPEAGIYELDRKTRVARRLSAVPGVVWYATALDDGTIVMSTAIEGAPQETDDRSRLITLDNKWVMRTIALGHWLAPRFVSGFSWPRLPRTQGEECLYVSCMNMSESHGDLMAFSPESLADTPGLGLVQEHLAQDPIPLS
jgi:hypothetical protein